MTLKTYKAKRNFKKTTEPSSRTPMARKKSKGKIFVIHKHDATHLHYDLRLEMDGVLKSWAVPKEPPREKGTKRLGIQVEDHPLGYATFKGRIPEGLYGAGTVEIWDSGSYELKNKDEKKIELVLRGKKMKGNYVLVKTSYGNKPEKSWLFFKI